jgi:broad specificity phosphatase PhoE
MATRYLYLVRHGQYRPEEGIGADVDGSLTGIGREQAQAVTEALRSVPVQAVYCSSMRRAMETAEIVASAFELTPEIIPELREVVPVIPPDLAEYFEFTMPDLTPERVAREKAMADAAFDRLFLPPETDEDIHEIVVSHGNIIQYLSCCVLGAPGELWLRLETNHCSITRCAIGSSGRMKLVSANDVGHLPTPLRLTS